MDGNNKRRRYYYDFEFLDDGRTIEVLSLGIVCEDGRELYLVSSECDLRQANDWVREHVVPFVGLNSPVWVTRDDMRARVRSFVRGDTEECSGDVTKPEFWGYYSAYDHVALAQLFGPMVEMPEGWPYYTRDVKQLAEDWGFEGDLYTLAPATGKAHNALDDARWIRATHEALVRWDAGMKELAGKSAGAFVPGGGEERPGQEDDRRPSLNTFERIVFDARKELEAAGVEGTNLIDRVRNVLSDLRFLRSVRDEALRAAGDPSDGDLVAAVRKLAREVAHISGGLDSLGFSDPDKSLPLRFADMVHQLEGLRGEHERVAGILNEAGYSGSNTNAVASAVRDVRGLRETYRRATNLLLKEGYRAPGPLIDLVDGVGWLVSKRAAAEAALTSASQVFLESGWDAQVPLSEKVRAACARFEEAVRERDDLRRCAEDVRAVRESFDRVRNMLSESGLFPTAYRVDQAVEDLLGRYRRAEQSAEMQAGFVRDQKTIVSRAVETLRMAGYHGDGSFPFNVLERGVGWVLEQFSAARSERDHFRHQYEATLSLLPDGVDTIRITKDALERLRAGACTHGEGEAREAATARNAFKLISDSLRDCGFLADPDRPESVVSRVTQLVKEWNAYANTESDVIQALDALDLPRTDGPAKTFPRIRDAAKKLLHERDKYREDADRLQKALRRICDVLKGHNGGIYFKAAAAAAEAVEALTGEKVKPGPHLLGLPARPAHVGEPAHTRFPFDFESSSNNLTALGEQIRRERWPRVSDLVEAGKRYVAKSEPLFKLSNGQYVGRVVRTVAGLALVDEDDDKVVPPEPELLEVYRDRLRAIRRTLASSYSTVEDKLVRVAMDAHLDVPPPTVESEAAEGAHAHA